MELTESPEEVGSARPRLQTLISLLRAAVPCLLLLLFLLRPEPVDFPAGLSLGLGAAGLALCLAAVFRTSRRGGRSLLAPTDAAASPVRAKLLLGALLALSAFCLLALLTRWPAFAALDAAFAGLVRGAATPASHKLVDKLSDLGGRTILVWWAPLLLVAMLLGRRGSAVGFFLATTLAIFPLEFFAKNLVLRNRPVTSDAVFPDSFPSGHVLAATVMAAATLLVWLPACRRPWQRGSLWTAAVVWTGLIAGSRVFLGRHYPADVVGGILLGLGWVLTCRTLAATRGAQPAMDAAPGVRRGWRLYARRTTLAVGAVLLVIGPWPLDSRGYDGEGYQRRTLAALTAAATRLDAAPGRLLAGYGEREISPRPGEPLGGYGKRWGRGCLGSHDRLKVRALALSDGGRPVVLLTGDLLLVNDALSEAVAADLAAAEGLRREQIYFGATHTHSGPGGYGTHPLEAFWLGDQRREVFVRLREALGGAAREALAGMRPAEWTYRSREVKRAVRNRVEPKRPVDPELSVLSIRRQEAPAEIDLVVFGAHATILGADNLLGSGDYPGYLTAYLEGRPGVKALFLAGAVGSCTYRGLGSERDFDAARGYARRLGERVEALLQGAEYAPSANVTALCSPVELGQPQVRIGKGLRASAIGAHLLLGEREGCVQALQVGDVLFLGAPADINGELALQVKERARARGYRPVVTSFSGRYIGYLVPERYYERASHMESRLMSLFGPHNGEYVASVLAAAAEQFPQRAGQVQPARRSSVSRTERTAPGSTARYSSSVGG